MKDTSDAIGRKTPANPRRDARRGGEPLRRARALTLATATLAVLTLMALIVPRWIEETTGVEPDGGNGGLEWLIVGAVALATLVSALRAQAAWRTYALSRG